MHIDYQHVDIAHDEYKVLSDVCFQAKEGDFIYLIGKVGTGKSSLLKTFYGETEIKKGNAKVLEYEMTKIKNRKISSLRQQLGIIFQDFQLLTDRNVADNLDFVLRATGWKKRKERRQRIDEVLTQVGMLEKKDKMPYELSGGEQQCVCIARAILNSPKIIIADEATGNLDIENSKRTTELLHEISKTGTTVIMSTHNEYLIKEFPGIVYRCKDGHVYECTEDFGFVPKVTDITSECADEINNIENN